MDIVARLKLNGASFTTELNKELGQVERKFGSTGSVIGRNLSEGIGSGLQSAASRVPVLGNALEGLSGPALLAAGGIGLVAAGATAAAAELSKLALRGLDFASGLGETAQQLGVTTDDLQLYRYAATQAGIDQETMDRSLAKLTQTLGKAAGGARAPAEAFRELGVGILDTNGHVRTAGEVIPEIADALARIEDPAKRAAIEVQLFGRAGQQLDTLLAGGSGEIDNLADAARRLGLVLSAEQIAKADEAADKLAAVKQVIEANIASAAADNADAILYLAEAFQTAAIKAVQFISRLDELRRATLTRVDARTGGVFGLTKRLNEEEATSMGLVYRPGGRLVSPASADMVGRPTRSASVIVDPDGEKNAAQARKARRDADEDAAKATREFEAALGTAGQRADEAMNALAQSRRTAQQTLSQTWTAFGVDPDADMERIAAKLDTAQVDRVSDLLTTDTGKKVADMMEDAGRRGGQAFRDAGIEGAQAIANVLGGRMGTLVSRALGAVDGARTGNFNSVGGPVGGVLTLLSGSSGTGRNSPFQKGLAEVFDPLKSSFDKLGGKLGISSGLGQTLGKAAGGVGLGSFSAGLAGSLGIGNGNSSLGAIGGALGGLTPLGPIGALAGGIVGSVVGGILSSTKKASATIGFTGSGLGVSRLSGNSGTFEAGAGDAASSVISGLSRIAEALGGTLTGSISTSIGIRHGDYRVDTTGRGKTKLGAGVVEFDKDAEGAIRFAISDALTDGVIQGISDASRRILASGQDLEKSILEASFIESLPKLLKQATDPLGAQIDALNDRWKEQIEILDRAGASAEQFADAQKLYQLELEQVQASTRGAAATLRDFLGDLNLGSSSPLSLRQQQEAAAKALQPFLDKIDGGQSVDQDKFAQAARSFLDVERQLNGSTAAFFAEFDRIQAYTNRAIEAIDKAEPIRPASDPFAERTARATQASAEIAADQTLLLQRMAETLEQLASGGFAANDYFGESRSFA